MRIGLPETPDEDEKPEAVYSEAGTRRYEVFDGGKLVRIKKANGVDSSGEELTTLWADAYEIVSGVCSCPGFVHRGECRHTQFIASAMLRNAS